MKKIVIDARMVGLEHAGIGRYVENLLSQFRLLMTQHPDWEFYLLVKPEKSGLLEKQYGPAFHYLDVAAGHYSLKEQFDLPLVLQKIHPDLIHFPHFNAPVVCSYPFVVTIHDLIKHTSKGKETTTRHQAIYWLKYWLYRFVFYRSIKKTSCIITPSLTVKKELVQKFHLTDEKIVPIYEGVEDKFKGNTGKKDNSQLLNQYGLKKPFLIYTGSLYPHKNIGRLIQAIKILHQSTINHQPLAINLVIACARNVFWERMKQKIQDLGVSQSVKLIGFIPDEDLISLYQEAIGFIQPSLMEGFDLPILEAMAVGLPCLVSDISVHREIYQDIPFYFNPSDTQDIAAKIKSLINSTPEELKNLSQKGKELASHFCWSQTARKTLNIYQSVLES